MEVKITRLEEGEKTNRSEHGEIKQGVRDVWDAVEKMRDGLVVEVTKRPREQDMETIRRQAAVIGGFVGIVGGGLLIGIIMRLVFG